ncbi:MAG: hypothetical protein RLZZ200_254 [Pseudomonadota bacterium]
MSNTVVTIDMLAKEALRLAHEKATFIGTVNRSYDDSFARTGAKIGSTLRVRDPNQYVRRQGSRIMDVQDQAETTQTVTVATQDGVDMRFNSAELALSIDELSDRYIKPAMSVLMSGIDGDCITTATKETYNTAGTAGTVVGAVTSGFSDTSALGYARAKLNQCLAPKDGSRVLQMDSLTMASVSNGIKGLFHPSSQIETAFREGYIAHTAMADLYENERTWTVANGDDVAGEIDESAATNFVEGATTLHIDGLGTGSLTKGQVFTIEGIYQCHPETKQAYSHLQQFVVAADVTIGSNEADVTFTPAIYTTGAKQNVCTSTGAKLTWTYTGQDGKDVTFWGSTSTSYRQNLMYHKEAYAFVTADLPIMDDAAKCVRQTQDGIALRVWQASYIRNDELLMRIDILYGFKTLRPAWGCRVSN